jgi:hypothetical protein
METRLEALEERVRTLEAQVLSLIQKTHPTRQSKI